MPEENINKNNYFIDLRFPNNTPAFWVRMADNLTHERAYEVVCEMLGYFYGDEDWWEVDERMFYLYDPEGEILIANITNIELVELKKGL